MSKYSNEFKLAVIKHYLSGRGGFKTVADQHGVKYAYVRKWVHAFKAHGQQSLNKSYVQYTGNSLSALVGIATIHLVNEPLLAMPLAASLPILVMFILRCLHPPAAAVALNVVLGHVMHYRYTFFPVMVDSILLVVAGKHYPSEPN